MTSPFEEDSSSGDKSEPVDLKKQYPDAKEVADFHRNSDRDKSKYSIHHSLGLGRYQASAGDHIHDGSSGTSLLGDSRFTGDVSNLFDLGNIVQSLLGDLTESVGGEDDTSHSGDSYDHVPYVTIASLRDLMDKVDDLNLEDDTGWTALSLVSGISPSPVYPQYMIRAGYISFRGGISNSSLAPSSDNNVASIPYIARPHKGSAVTPAATEAASVKGVWLFRTSGMLELRVGSLSGYYYLDGITFPVGY